MSGAARSALLANSLRRKREALRQLDRQESRWSLASFVRRAWRVLEPTAPYVHEWHVDAVCQHLEAVTDGRITRLLVNVPPGTMKSLLASVFWPAWEWGPRAMPSLRYLATSFNEGPVKRDTRKMRDLVASDWYQDRWPDVKLTRTGETSFANSCTGTREGVPFGSLTSQRGDRLIIDDPHSTETAESAAERERTTRKFREGASNRLNDQDKSAIVVIMQRLHEEDVSGVILRVGMQYDWLRLPMEYEAQATMLGEVLADPHRPTSIGFVDPRRSDGELLAPKRFPRAVVDQLKVDLGSHAYAGQYQQRPSAREGSLFRRTWFEGRVVGQAPAGTQWVRHWDLAATRGGGGAYTAGVKLGRAPDGRFYVGSVVRVREEGHEVRRVILQTAQADGPAVQISLPQDPGQAGKVQAADMVAMLPGYVARAQPETGDKYTRALPFSVQCEAGNVYLVRGLWNEEYLNELCRFPGASVKDQVDASSGAFGCLITRHTVPVAETGSFTVG